MMTAAMKLKDVCSLDENMLSRLVIAIHPRSKHLLISWLQSTICSDFGAQENKIQRHHFARACLIAQLVKNPPAMQETLIRFLGWEDPLKKDRLPTPVFLGFPCRSASKESACNVGDLGWIPGLGRSPGVGNGNPLQYSGLENSMDYIVHGVAKSWT